MLAGIRSHTSQPLSLNHWTVAIHRRTGTIFQQGGQGQKNFLSRANWYANWHYKFALNCFWKCEISWWMVWFFRTWNSRLGLGRSSDHWTDWSSRRIQRWKWRSCSCSSNSSNRNFRIRSWHTETKFLLHEFTLLCWRWRSRHNDTV